MPEFNGTEPELTEGDGKTTSSQTPDDRNSGVSGPEGRGMVPQAQGPRSGESFGAAFEGYSKRSPFVEMLSARIKQKQQEKTSMEITSHTLRAFQDELGHLREEKQASVLSAVGKGVMGLARGGAKGGLRRGMGAGALNLARKAGFRGAAAHKAIGGATLAAGGLAAAGTGAALAG